MIKHSRYLDFFHYPTFRSSKEQIIEYIDQAIHVRKNVLSVAPNGTGKTILALRFVTNELFFLYKEMSLLFLMITKIFEYWVIDLLGVVKMIYPPLIDENTIIYYAVSFFITILFFIGLVVDIIREFFKEERHFDFVYAAMGLIVLFYVGGALIPYAIEYFPPFGH